MATVNAAWFQEYIDGVMLSSWKNNPHTIHLFKQDYKPDPCDIKSMDDIPAAVITCSTSLVNRQCEAGVIKAENPVFANAVNKGPFGGFLISDDINGVVVMFDCDANGLNIHMNGTDIILAFNPCGIAAI